MDFQTSPTVEPKARAVSSAPLWLGSACAEALAAAADGFREFAGVLAVRAADALLLTRLLASGCRSECDVIHVLRRFADLMMTRVKASSERRDVQTAFSHCNFSFHNLACIS
jgi:hypothetical protein